ncbi:helix-turn-helix domain-containing protein [Chitinophaga defluvii]|uniref:AraC family transcriptional regulator n=1 Tax=Chitinophaga defluvii TaxID=3163343 RepID=A0ABV2T3D6_9BACT
MKRKEAISEYHLNKHRPDKPQFAIHDLKAYLTLNQGKANKPHIHSFFQIIWFKKGSGKHFVDFKAYDVFENAIFFIARNQVHYFDENTEYDGVLIHFSELFLTPNESSIDYLMKCSLFNNPYQMPSCCIGSNIEATLSIYINQIYTELETEEDFASDELLRTYLKAFLIQVQRGRNDFERANGKTPFMLDEKREQLIRFVNFVDEHFIKGVTVAEYAQLLHISSRTLSDLTAQTLNKTPLTVIQERTVLEAQRLLLHSDLNVNQIGYRLGFDDPSYFVKYFKKHTKISPSEFRKSIS